MDNIVVVFSKPEDAKGVKGLLVKNGFSVAAACTSGAQALAQMDEWNDGIVICGYKLTDMMYSELHGCLPKGVDMLLMAPQRVISPAETIKPTKAPCAKRPGIFFKTPSLIRLQRQNIPPRLLK